MRRTERELEGKFEEALGLLGPKGRGRLALAAVRLGGEKEGQGGSRRPAVALFGLRGEPAFSLEVELPANTLERITASDLADVLAEQVLGDARHFAEPRERRDAEALLGEGGAAVAQASRRWPFKNLDEILEIGADASPLFEAHVSMSDRALPGEGLLENLWHSGTVVPGTARLRNRGPGGGTSAMPETLGLASKIGGRAANGARLSRREEHEYGGIRGGAFSLGGRRVVGRLARRAFRGTLDGQAPNLGRPSGRGRGVVRGVRVKTGGRLLVGRGIGGAPNPVGGAR